MSASDDLAAALDLARFELGELAPVLRRATGLDPHCLARVRVADGTVAVYVRLPFEVLVSRTVASSASASVDAAVRAAVLVEWLDGERTEPPESEDEAWRWGLPPRTGWQRIDTVPDDVVRGLVRTGALALKEAAQRDGVPGAEPRAEVTAALLDAVVLTVTAPGQPTAEIPLRVLSAVTRMGFLPRGSHIAVDVAGRWIRVAAQYGSVFAERPGLNLGLLSH